MKWTNRFKRCTKLHLVRQIISNLFGISLLLLSSFILLRCLPGDPLQSLFMSDYAVQPDGYTEQLLREELGISGSWWQQFCHYLRHLSRGDLGFSAYHGRAIADLIFTALPWSLGLMLCSLPLALLLGVGGGLLAGIYSGQRIDRLISGLAALLASLPTFSIAMLLLMIFAIRLNWFPAYGGCTAFNTTKNILTIVDMVWHAILPTIALSLHGCVRFFYLARGIAQRISLRPFIFAARARGIGGFQLFFRYYLRNARAELLAKLSGFLPTLLGTTVFVEVIFAYPGIGLLILNGIHQRDYVLVQGAILVVGIMVMLINSLIDYLVQHLNQRG